MVSFRLAYLCAPPLITLTRGLGIIWISRLCLLQTIESFISTWNWKNQLRMATKISLIRIKIFILLFNIALAQQAYRYVRPGSSELWFPPTLVHPSLVDGSNPNYYSMNGVTYYWYPGKQNLWEREWERETEWERQGEKERGIEKQRERERVCVCVTGWLISLKTVLVTPETSDQLTTPEIT